MAAESNLGTAPQNRSMSLRAILIGSLLAVGVNLITPFNDYVVVNTFMVGSYLPLALILAIVFVVMIGNGLLRAVLPRHALHTGEISVLLMMLLVACAIPSQGLLRMLVPSMTTPFYYGDTMPSYYESLRHAGIPDWLFPAAISDPKAPQSSIIKNFYGKVPDGSGQMLPLRTWLGPSVVSGNHFPFVFIACVLYDYLYNGAIPYGPWIRPILAWGVYLAGFFSACIALAYLFRMQWAENERLAFPLVQLQTSLIEAPEPGRALNSLFRHRSFWITTVAILIVHSLNALHLYNDNWPEFPRAYDLRPVTGEPPWSYVSEFIRSNRIYFTFIGATYFIRSRTAFSIWFIYLLTQIYSSIRTGMQIPVPGTQVEDQHIGACIAFSIGMIWIARALLWNALKGAFGAAHTAGRDQAWAMRLLLVGIAIMFGWMIVVGFHPALAIVAVVMVLMAHVVTGRIVAETGIPYLRTNPTVLQLVQNLPATSIQTKDAFFAGLMSVNGAVQTRESLFGLSQNGMRLMDDAGAMRKRFGWLALICAWTLVISLAAGWWSSLTCYYSYAAPISMHTDFQMLNQDIATNHTKSALVDSVVSQTSGAFPQKAYNVPMHVGIGFVIVLILQLGSWTFAGWPLLPIGFILAGTPLITNAWFSVLLGWLAKVILQKLGGNKLLLEARPVFIGLIFGEALAAAIWMVISLLLAINGYDYWRYSALPT